MVAGSSTISAAAPGEGGGRVGGPLRNSPTAPAGALLPPGPPQHSHCLLPYPVLSPQPLPWLPPWSPPPPRSPKDPPPAPHPPSNPPLLRCRTLQPSPRTLPPPPTRPLCLGIPFQAFHSQTLHPPPSLSSPRTRRASGPSPACPITQGSPEFQRSPGAPRIGHGLHSTRGRGHASVRQRNTVHPIPQEMSLVTQRIGPLHASTCLVPELGLQAPERRGL